MNVQGVARDHAGEYEIAQCTLISDLKYFYAF